MKITRLSMLLMLTIIVVLLSPLDAAADGPWYAEYYANPWLQGAPTVVRSEAALHFDWGMGSPDPLIPVDNFSARWTGGFYFEQGRYSFTTESDDGVRLYVDGNLVIDRWYDMSRSLHSGEIDLATGWHSIRLEYYEHEVGAYVSLSWTGVEPPAAGGNIITCVRPGNSWIKIYRLEDDGWLDINPHGWGPISDSGFLKIDGIPVDMNKYGYSGQPYRVELWAEGTLIRSVGYTEKGEPSFRVYPANDNPTPWGCPAP